MTTPEQPHEGDLNQPQQPQQPVVPPQPAAPQQPQQLSREQLEAQYNQQQAPQQPQMPQAPQQQQQPGYQAPQQPSPAPQAPQYGAPQPQGQQPFAQPNQYGQQPHYAQPGQYQQAQYQQPVAYGEPGPGEPFNGATSPDDLTRPLYGATFGQSIRRFFKNYVNFKGRASRSEYWWVQLFLTLVFLLPTAVYFIGLLMTIGAAASTTYYDEVTGTFVESGSAATYGPGLAVLIISGVLMLVMGLATILPSLGLAWRRLHDANFAGPFYLLTLTSIGSIVVLVFTILGPKPEGRRFDQR